MYKQILRCFCLLNLINIYLYGVNHLDTKGLKGNARIVADYLNEHASNSTLNLINDLKGHALNRALNSISPARNDVGGFINDQNAFLLSHLTMSHIEYLEWLEKRESQEECMASQLKEATGILDCWSSCEKHQHFSVWLAGFTNFAHAKGLHHNPSFDFNSQAISIGCDYGNPETSLAGISLGYTHSHFSDQHHQGHGSIHSGFFSLYGSLFFHHFYIKPIVWGILNTHSDVRHISFSGFSKEAKAKIETWQLVPHVEIGYVIEVEKWGEFIPFVAIDYIMNRRRHYKEQGAAPFNAKQESEITHVLKNEVGIRCLERFTLNWGELLMKEKLGYVFEKPFGGHVTASLTGISETFTVDAFDQPLHLGSIGLELFANIDGSFPLGVSLGYEGEFGKDYFSNEVTLVFSKKF